MSKTYKILISRKDETASKTAIQAADIWIVNNLDGTYHCAKHRYLSPSINVIKLLQLIGLE